MDATQKRRMWKVAIVHFFLSVFIAAAPFLPLLSNFCSQESGYTIWSILSLLFQPALKLGPIAFVLFPIWSFCFAWIFIRTKDWLNHFPILGIRVLKNRKSAIVNHKS
jgi:hypothetical protein